MAGCPDTTPAYPSAPWLICMYTYKLLNNNNNKAFLLLNENALWLLCFYTFYVFVHGRGAKIQTASECDAGHQNKRRELKSLWSVRSKSCRGSCDDDDSLSNFTSELKMRQRCTLQDLNRARPASSSARPIRLASPLLSAVTAESTAKTAATKSDAVSDKLFFLFYPSGSFLSI